MIFEDLYTELHKLSAQEGIESIFEESGMLNKYRELSYGFFPLGTGILADHKNNTTDTRIMVLGNDFGTADYLKTRIDNGHKESPSNPTISNLLKKLPLDKTTFFTNFHLGVRLAGTNTKRVIQVQKAFRNLCFDFLLTQLSIANPKIILCLGHEVRLPLTALSPQFANWTPKNITLKELYAKDLYWIDATDEKLGFRRFIVIPHPCDRRNFNDCYIQKILQKIADFG